MSIIEIKIVLQDIEPAVTRTLRVPADIRLDRLHLTVQAAMGWTNSHLYMFQADGISWGVPDPDFESDDQPANKTSLNEVFQNSDENSINYVYDFGDNWRHRIIVTKTADPVPGELYPRLIEIIGRCPPEDVGGIPGYYAFLEAVTDPKHPEHDRLKDWFGETFDPNQPQSDELKLEVLKLAKKWQPKKAR